MARYPRSELNKKLVRQIGLVPFIQVNRNLAICAGLTIWGGILLAWALVTYGGLIPPMFLPKPDQVVTTAFAMAQSGELWVHLFASLQVVLIGFLVSSIVAVPLGLAMGTYGAARALFDPLVNFARYLPVSAFVPLFILWIGIGIEQRVAVIIFGVFFQQLVMIADCARSVPRDLVNASYTLGTRNGEILRKIVFPAALPDIMDVLRVTMGWAWTYLVVAELVAARSGLGYISLIAMRGFKVDIIFMAIGLIGILGLLTDRAFLLARRGVAPWAK